MRLAPLNLADVRRACVCPFRHTAAETRGAGALAPAGLCVTKPSWAAQPAAKRRSQSALLARWIQIPALTCVFGMKTDERE